MRSSSKWILTVGLVALLGYGVYAFIFNWMVPKTAKFGVPARWGRVPMKQPAETVHGYFGEPAGKSLLAEEWNGGTHRNKYVLKIYYAPDSTVMAYSVYYSYKSWLVNKDYLLDSSSIR